MTGFGGSGDGFFEAPANVFDCGLRLVSIGLLEEIQNTPDYL